MMRKIVFSLTLLVHACVVSLSQESLQSLYTKASNAYKNGDHKAFLEGMLQVDQLRPNHPTVLYNLSIAYAKNGLTGQAVKTLERVVWMNAQYEFESDRSFSALKNLPGFKALVSLKGQLQAPLRGSGVFREIDKQYITHAEGMAYDKITQRFFLSDVYNRKIIAIGSDGKVEDFTKGNDLMSAMGMAIDEQHKLLWICSTYTDEMLKPEAGSAKENARLLAFNIESGELVTSAIAKNAKAFFGDLIVAKNGDVYATSSAADHAVIYKFDFEKQQLEALYTGPELVSLQGLVLDETEEYLFFADYREGLFKLNLATGKRVRLLNYTKQSLKGIDGLYLHEGWLIAIHNGLRPFQVTAYQLTRDREGISAFKHLDRALPEMGEPTLGTIVDGHLYYIANSAWPLYDRQRNLDLDKVRATLILNLDLNEMTALNH